MKKLMLIFICLATSAILLAQAPAAFKYQAVARDGSGTVLADKTVSFRISIIQGTITGDIVYSEKHNTVTNEFGLVNLEIGKGAPVSGDMSRISWGVDEHFIRVEMDPDGGNSFQLMGTSQLLSVPYSLYAKTAESLRGGITETDPVFAASPAKGISSTNIIKWDSAYGWGNHAKAGYLTNFMETDTALWKKSGTDIFYNTGNVGIGTNSPLRKLDVNGAALFRIDANKAIIFDNAGTALRMYTDDYTGGAIGKDLVIGTYPKGHMNQLYLSTSGNVGIGTNSPQRILDVNGSALFRIDASKAIIFDNAGTALRMYTDDFTGGAIGKDLVIGTYPNGHMNQLYLSTSGKVGIGTNEPQRKLDVNGQVLFRIDANKAIIFDKSGPALRMYTDDYTGGVIGQDLVIGTYPNGHGNQLYLNTAGNVGIGTTNPQRKLHINDVLRLEPRNDAPASPAKGDIYFDGTLNKLRVYDGTTWQNCW
ncbi:MAG: hypothetical protein NTV01_17490 [Bacteroidia bacterium]|nr:hypothetical protein [Bacteroidia bacterium]